jgi:hypothetical protein
VRKRGALLYCASGAKNKREETENGETTNMMSTEGGMGRWRVSFTIFVSGMRDGYDKKKETKRP